MTITRVQVDALNDGDVVTVSGWNGLRVTGAVRRRGGPVTLGPFFLSFSDPQMPSWTQVSSATLRVLERATPQLYVNSDRRNPVPGDVVTRQGQQVVFLRSTDARWIDSVGKRWGHIAGPLVLVFDGLTHEVVR